jgi:hypothetical protein
VVQTLAGAWKLRQARDRLLQEAGVSGEREIWGGGRSGQEAFGDKEWGEFVLGLAR